jgi:hypothetical protein
MLSVLVLVMIAAASAVADPIGAVTINGAPARECGTHGGFAPSADYCVGSAPLVTVTLPDQNAGGLPNERYMGVKNDEADGFDEITAVSADINPGVGNADFAGGYTTSPLGPIKCAPNPRLTIKCATFPAQRGFTAGFVYTLIDRQSGYHGGLNSLAVEFNYGGSISPCAGPAAPGGTQSQASAATRRSSGSPRGTLPNSNASSCATRA